MAVVVEPARKPAEKMVGDLVAHPAAELFPMHTAAELAALAQSIGEHGWDETHPVVLCDGKILDGRNRYRVCLDLGVTPTFVEYVGNPFEKAWSENGARRDIEAGRKGAIRLQVNAASADWQARQQDRHAEANRKRSESQAGVPKAAAKERARSRDTARSHASPARTDLAKQAGIGEATAGRVQAVASKRPDLLDQVADGKLTLAEAVQKTKRDEVISRLDDVAAREVKAASGVYDVIVIDPPWPMEKIERDVRPNQVGFDYPTMSEGELADLLIPAATDCHVWLWTTQKFLPMAFRLLDAWGLRYVCTFVWHKPGGFQPIGLPQYNCEFALYARRGVPMLVDTKALPTCFDAPRGKHSEKPEAFYEVVRRVTAGRRLDMFNRRAIDGFDSWGQEAIAS